MQEPVATTALAAAIVLTVADDLGGEFTLGQAAPVIEALAEDLTDAYQSPE